MVSEDFCRCGVHCDTEFWLKSHFLVATEAARASSKLRSVVVAQSFTEGQTVCPRSTVGERLDACHAKADENLLNLQTERAQLARELAERCARKQEHGSVDRRCRQKTTSRGGSVEFLFVVTKEFAQHGFESGREQFNESPAHVSCAEVPIVSRRRLVTLSHQQGSAREVQCRELPR